MAAWIILTASLILGQIAKFPQGAQGGLTALDLGLVALNLFALAKLKLKLKKPPLWLTAALIFILIALISLLLTPLNLTTGQYFNSFAYTLRFANFILFGWVILSGAFPQILKNTNKILLFSGIGLSILGLLQLIFIPNLMFISDEGWDPHFFRTVSTLLDPNFTGAYLALTMMVLVTTAGRMFPKKLRVLLFTIVYLAFVTTFSRSSALLLISAFSTLALLKRSIKLFLFGLILFAGFFLVFNTYQKTVAEPRNIDRQQSAQARFDTWQQGLEMFQKSPVLGVGFNAYRYALGQYNLAPPGFLESRGSSTNDSSLLYILATTGILGAVAYLGFLLLAAKQAFAHKREWGLIYLAALAGLLPNSFFVNSLFYPWFLLWIILAAVKASETGFEEAK